MAFDKRQLVIAGRIAAALGLIAFRGRARAASWAAHDFLWLFPTLRRNCNWHGEVLTRFETSEPEVWLTIDDGPDPRDTPGLLEALASHNARATFFAVGQKAEENAALCQRIVAEGHTLGNHTYSHPTASWWVLPPFFIQSQIARAREAITAASGQAPAYFRSPVGMNNLSVHPVAARLGHRVVGWSAEGCDGCPCAPSHIVQNIMQQVRPGAIILLHESGGSRHRVLTLHRLLEHLSRAGYRCVLPLDSALR